MSGDREGGLEIRQVREGDLEREDRGRSCIVALLRERISGPAGARTQDTQLNSSKRCQRGPVSDDARRRGTTAGGALWTRMETALRQAQGRKIRAGSPFLIDDSPRDREKDARGVRRVWVSANTPWYLLDGKLACCWHKKYGCLFARELVHLRDTQSRRLGAPRHL